FRLHAPEEIEESRNDACPPGLMARPEACAVIALEVLVKENEIAPVRIVLELRGASIDRAAAGGVPQKDVCESLSDLLCDFEERHPIAGARRTFDLKVVAVEAIEVQESTHDE